MERDGGEERLIKDAAVCVGKREMRRLIFGCDLKQLFLCGALKMDPRSFPFHPAAPFLLPVYCLQRDESCSSPEREKESENQSDLAINHSAEEKCFTKECECLLLLLCGSDLGTVRWKSFSWTTPWRPGCCNEPKVAL